MAAKVLYLCILFLMGINGALHISAILTPPNPDKIGIWFSMFLLVFPLLGILGVMALLASQAWRIPIWVGIFPLLCVVPPPLLMLLGSANHPSLSWLFEGLSGDVFEKIVLGLYLIALIGLLALMPKVLRRSIAS